MARVIPSSFQFEQTVPSTEWTIQHNLGTKNRNAGVPVVEVMIDFGDGYEKMIPEILYVDKDTVKIVHSEPRVGKAVVVV